MTTTGPRYQDYLSGHGDDDPLEDRIEMLMYLGRTRQEALAFIASGQADVRHERPEQVTIAEQPSRGRPTCWSAVWWHPTDSGLPDRDLIRERRDFYGDSPGEAIAWANQRSQDVLICAGDEGYVPLSRYEDSHTQ